MNTLKMLTQYLMQKIMQVIKQDLVDLTFFQSYMNLT